ncbi:MAG: hypothetical protein AAGD10_03995 [Myxococcota bacterium]
METDGDDMTEDIYGEEKYERDRQRGRVVGEFVRRAIDNAFEQVQSSSAAPKEALSFLLHQGDKGRREVVRIVAKEVGDFLRATDLSSEVIKVLTGVQAELNVKVKFRRTEGGGVKPDLDGDIKIPEPLEPDEEQEDSKLDPDASR